MLNSVQSAKQHLFSLVPNISIPRSTFDRSSGHKTTFNSGYLVPVFVDEVLPGDTFIMDATILARLNTPIFPIMDNLILDIHFFFVPNRLIWTNFKKMMGEQDNPGDSTSYVIPTSTGPAGGHAVGSLHNYMGIPSAGQITGANQVTHNNLPLRAYNKIYNDWYRDENLQNSATVDMGDGPDTYTNYTLLKRGKRHDYFTSCLPWTQKGTAVSIPLGSIAPVVSNAGNISIRGGSGAMTALYTNAGAGTSPYIGTATSNSNANFGPSGTTSTGLQADLTSATAATINQLRQAFQLQVMMERDALGGTRYIEIIKKHFGVDSPDARLQRSEYLGGGSAPINISSVPKTSSTDGTSPQGNLAAFGATILRDAKFIKSFTEHGYIIGIISARADLSYQQGLNRLWKKSTKYDIFWPGLAQIGEQAVLQGELFCQGTSADDTVFGYQERYAEYRYKPSLITGILNSTSASTLDAWHLSQKFTSAPTLNSTFITESPPVSRIVAVPSQPEFLFDSFFKLKCVRPMPLYGVPMGLGRF